MFNEKTFMIDNKIVSLEKFTKKVPGNPLTLKTIYGNLVHCKNEEEAGKYKDWMARCYMKWFGYSRKKALEIINQNIGYYAGYFRKETASRVLSIFKTEHPIFGNLSQITPEKAYEIGHEIDKENNQNELPRKS